MSFLFFILGYFLLFYPHVYHKWHMITYMMYGSWDLERDRQKLWSFWTIFCPTTSLITWKIKILKKWKNARWYHLHIHTKNYDHIMYSSWDMVHNGWVDRIDGQTDRQKEWHTEVGAPPKNNLIPLSPSSDIQNQY